MLRDQNFFNKDVVLVELCFFLSKGYVDFSRALQFRSNSALHEHFEFVIAMPHVPDAAEQCNLEALGKLSVPIVHTEIVTSKGHFDALRRFVFQTYTPILDTEFGVCEKSSKEKDPEEFMSSLLAEMRNSFRK